VPQRDQWLSGPQRSRRDSSAAAVVLAVTSSGGKHVHNNIDGNEYANADNG